MNLIRNLRIFLVLPTLFSVDQLSAQRWVDTVFQIQIERDLVYGISPDFAGNSRTLRLDVAVPLNDTPPECGRPLIVFVHGGAFMAGSKADSDVRRLMTDFAKRGYVAVSTDYRKGAFNTDRNHSCAFSQLFNIEWNCLNVQDTAEWYRSWYRGVQDVHGALRYMALHANTYRLDRHNVFVAGFSAGGFIALGTGFLDHSSEIRNETKTIPAAVRPNAVFENGCIQKYGWDTSLNSLQLLRSSLGDYRGSLNTNSPEYTIRGIGNFFGALFYNLLDSSDGSVPDLYTYHQPNDLIVPYDSGKRVFQGYSACMYSLCNKGLLNMPKCYSSTWLKNTSARIKQAGGIAPDVYFDSTTNRTDCLGQIANPSLGGHQLDNYWLRTNNMARFFSGKIDSTECQTGNANHTHAIQNISVGPNPFDAILKVQSDQRIRTFDLYDFCGHTVLSATLDGNSETLSFETEHLQKGLYFLKICSDRGQCTTMKLIKK